MHTSTHAAPQTHKQTHKRTDAQAHTPAPTLAPAPPRPLTPTRTYAQTTCTHGATRTNAHCPQTWHRDEQPTADTSHTTHAPHAHTTNRHTHTPLLTTRIHEHRQHTTTQTTTDATCYPLTPMSRVPSNKHQRALHDSSHQHPKPQAPHTQPSPLSLDLQAHHRVAR
jgi:hypothetical protein